ncbi:hypothetical protein NCC78_29450 [Micromonospora phytophila]|uniref:hypothetical protein n=1 Tax=Micromonospora phytophila TaxID=709888 RepID=UPI002030A97F|nr:hypothetical protein [Micromonospora phytophila]MCM0678770.1 hypothetical protein [Micromonospora phytophila]
MTQRVVVDDVGIRTEDDRHAFGWPWSEIQHVSVAVLPLTEHRHLYFEVTHVSGEFMELGESVDGFREAVRDISARAGRPAPDLDALRPADPVRQIWPSPEVGG